MLFLSIKWLLANGTLEMYSYCGCKIIPNSVNMVCFYRNNCDVIFVENSSKKMSTLIGLTSILWARDCCHVTAAFSSKSRVNCLIVRHKSSTSRSKFTLNALHRHLENAKKPLAVILFVTAQKMSCSQKCHMGWNYNNDCTDTWAKVFFILYANYSNCS